MNRDQLREIRKRHHVASPGPYYWEKELDASAFKYILSLGLLTRSTTRQMNAAGKQYPSSRILKVVVGVEGDEALALRVQGAMNPGDEDPGFARRKEAEGAPVIHAGMVASDEDREFLAASWKDVNDLLAHVAQLERKLANSELLFRDAVSALKRDCDRSVLNLARVADDISAAFK